MRRCSQIGRRIGQVSQQGQHVLDLVRVEEPQPFVDIRRDAALLERLLELAMALARAKQNRDVSRPESGV